jgi:hypothetical protein
MRRWARRYDGCTMNRSCVSAAVSALFALTACVTAVAPPAAPQMPFAFAAFAGIEQSVQGGPITRVVYAEKSGDASLSLVSVDGGEILVKGRLSTKANSRWAGVGIVIGAPSGAVDASGFKALRIRLSAAPGVDKLRVRLSGSEEAVILSGCYPVAVQAVTPQVTEYEIEFSRFAPERFCGTQGVAMAATATRLAAVEVVDAASPVRERAVEFTVGNIALVR